MVLVALWVSGCDLPPMSTSAQQVEEMAAKVVRSRLSGSSPVVRATAGAEWGGYYEAGGTVTYSNALGGKVTDRFLVVMTREEGTIGVQYLRIGDYAEGMYPPKRPPKGSGRPDQE